MSWEYSCPKCHAMLNPDRTIVLTATHDGDRVLIGLHPQPGKYEVYLPPAVHTVDGDHWTFACPMCQGDLRTDEDENLCELVLSIDGEPLRILFSRVAGEHATFIMHGREVRERFGDDSPRYDQLVGQEKYLR